LLSPADMLIIGAAALIFFGPDQLPKVARRAGQVMRDVQNTSQSFIREMERAGETPDDHTGSADGASAYEYRSYAEPTPAPHGPDLSVPFTYAAPGITPPESPLPEPALHDPLAGTHPPSASPALPHDGET